jgi:hypothetical protein
MWINEKEEKKKRKIMYLLSLARIAHQAWRKRIGAAQIDAQKNSCFLTVKGNSFV